MIFQGEGSQAAHDEATCHKVNIQVNMYINSDVYNNCHIY